MLLARCMCFRVHVLVLALDTVTLQDTAASGNATKIVVILQGDIRLSMSLREWSCAGRYMTAAPLEPWKCVQIQACCWPLLALCQNAGRDSRSRNHLAMQASGKITEVGFSGSHGCYECDCELRHTTVPPLAPWRGGPVQACCRPSACASPQMCRWMPRRPCHLAAFVVRPWQPGPGQPECRWPPSPTSSAALQGP